MRKAKTKAKPENHPEVEKTKNVCDILPEEKDIRQVCKPLNEHRKEQPQGNKK